MPKIVCRCGEFLRYGEIPCPIEWRFISDTDFDQFSGAIDSEELYLNTKGFLRCPHCGRIWIFWNGYGELPEEFVPVGKHDER